MKIYENVKILKLNNIRFFFPLKRLNASKIVSKIKVFDGL